MPLAYQEFVLNQPLDRKRRQGGERDGKKVYVDKVRIVRSLERNLTFSLVRTVVSKENLPQAKLRVDLEVVLFALDNIIRISII